ncbi:MAG: hypothetical protein VX916_07820 [Planctomycetota bacterium]|nr:hypothetical protein [Planctomycetota bacterium]
MAQPSDAGGIGPATYFRVSATIFLVVAVLHLLRVVKGWSLEIGGTPIAPWVSVVLGLLLLFLSWSGYRYAKVK